MYLGKSITEGLSILGFDKATIKKVSKERTLEDIFLSTLFMNYIIVLIAYLIGVMLGGYTIQGRELNMPVIFGLMMVYPFAYNIVVYAVYGFFGLMAELLDKRNHVKPLVSVGFHTAIVYAVLFYLIAMVATASLSYAGILIAAFMAYFFYVMFLSISTVYNFSLSQTLIVLIVPFLILGMAILVVQTLAPDLAYSVLEFLLA